MYRNFIVIFLAPFAFIIFWRYPPLPGPLPFIPIFLAPFCLT